MQGSIPAQRLQLLRKISGRVARPGKSRPPLDLKAFVQAYYRGVGEEDLGERTADDLAGAAIAHLATVMRREAATQVVRVYDPQPQTSGWLSPHTIVEVTTEDMPFLVDSLAIVMNRAGLRIHLTVHPVLHVRRDRAGRLIAIEPDAGSAATVAESWQHLEVDRIGDPLQQAQLQRQIQSMLEDLRFAVRDWRAMRGKMQALAQQAGSTQSKVSKQEAQESAALLQWLADDHFTFLGYREYKLRRERTRDVLEPLNKTRLGIQRARRLGSRPRNLVLKGEMRKYANDPALLTIAKANAIATIHRAVYLDYIGVKTFDTRGRVTGEHRFLGLFTSSAYSGSPGDIPLLRHKVERVVNHLGAARGSHDGKAVMHVLETYPRDELFQASVADLTRIVRGVVNLYERERVRLFVRRDPLDRFYSCLVYVPRDRYTTQVRQIIESILLDAFGASSLESQVQLSESRLARVLIILRSPAKHRAQADIEAIERRISQATWTWEDHFRNGLIEAHGEGPGLELARRYAAAFPLAYQADVDAAAALLDLQKLRELETNRDALPMRVLKGSAESLHLRTFHTGAPIVLSEALPLLENLGFTVVTERPYRVSVSESLPVWLQDFELEPRVGGLRYTPELGNLLADAINASWTARVENDGFNELVIAARLPWRQAMIFRAYCRYLLQIGLPFSQSYMSSVLARHGKPAELMWKLFAAKFDPRLNSKRRNSEKARLLRQIDAQLDGIGSQDEDRILRMFLTVICASTRTNYFQCDAAGQPKQWLAIKLSSRSIPEVPLPKPLFEIFVYSPRVEGVHLRNGYVARGGIRWSDRREDFRTEILGLLKAQHVKNTLIVPVGAKGGFVCKKLPAGGSRDDVQREVTSCYRTFIRGLLDVTDNIVNGKVIAPTAVVREDGDDAYLVVAADKGTATFSDLANGIAADYNFWLGDAFASGGSAGYDHKKMAITARGAWECVKRHFRELGRDIQREPFGVCGIGDMSGDVFGNGMLQSKQIRLTAAFNHQHIFLDPDPDLHKSYRERERLFQLPRSGWNDYDPQAISKGGGIYERSVKSIRLSREAKDLLAIEADSLTPQELIRHLLRMPVDLLWNGGIGTYVKASHESHAEVGDRTNDAVRVDANELHCLVVGEGGNLGLSQRGRIEYAARGGRLNTDFIDNSAGVDCSDHEVNIKIMLNVARERGGLTLARRNRMLAAMTDDVARLVLRDNYLQSQALSIVELQAPSQLGEHGHFIRALELSGQLNRELEFLPSAEEIADRGKVGRGLTRPELAVLLSYSKIALYGHLIESDVPEDAYLRHELDRYFPEAIRRNYLRLLQRHRLRREIIATATTNSLVNRMGPTFAHRTQEDTGAAAATVARAYSIAREAFDMRSLWAAIEAMDNKIPAAIQYEMLLRGNRLLKQATYWLIYHNPQALEIERLVLQFRPLFAQLAADLPQALDASAQTVFQATQANYVEQGVSESVARRIASLTPLHCAPDIAELALEHRKDVRHVAKMYFILGASLSLDWIRERIEDLQTAGHWHAVARGTLRDEVFSLQRAVCEQVIAFDRERDPTAAIERWQHQHRAKVEHVRSILEEMRSLASVDFATLSVALQALRRLTESAQSP